jgi:methylated-DNA-protein-cysteine methyltransferase-like protein
MRKRKSTKNRFDLIYDLVRMIPEGRVASYGQIACCIERCTPRMVGFAMAAVPFDSDVPWHRVINSKGMISVRSGGDGASIQQVLLEAEGVCFDKKGRVDLAEAGWEGPGAAQRPYRDRCS